MSKEKEYMSMGTSLRQLLFRAQHYPCGESLAHLTLALNKTSRTIYKDLEEDAKRCYTKDQREYLMMAYRPGLALIHNMKIMNSALVHQYKQDRRG